MSDLELKLQEITEDLQDLISLAAQNADKANLGIVTRFEKFEKELAEKHDQRWSLFKWSVGIAAVVFTVVIPIMFIAVDKLHDQTSALAQRLAVIETNDKDQVVSDRFTASIKELEKKDSEIITLLNERVTQKDLGHLKSELYELIIRMHNKEKAGETK